MERNHDPRKINRALREILLEASEDEMREALAGTGQDLESVAAMGRELVQGALKSTPDSGDLKDLHRSLGVLLQMLRRRDRVTVDQLASKARIDVEELRQIELDPTFDPNPRTVFQLERYFDLPAKSLAVLSGAVRVASEVREECVRFAASSEGISELTRGERKLLNRFVRFLQEHTDG